MTTTRSPAMAPRLDLWLCPRDEQPPLPTDERTALPPAYLLAGIIRLEEPPDEVDIRGFGDDSTGARTLTSPKSMRLDYTWRSRPLFAPDITYGREYVGVLWGISNATHPLRPVPDCGGYYVRGVAPCMVFIGPGRISLYPDAGGDAMHWYYARLVDA